jgi:protease I
MSEQSVADEHRTVAFLVAMEGIESDELTRPWRAVEEAGHRPVLVSLESGTVQLFEHLDKGGTQQVDKTIDEVAVGDFDALVLPGGVANPDSLRLSAPAVAFTRDFVESGKPVAAICHAPWVLVEAGVVAGRRLTSWPSVRTDIVNAGGQWVDEALVVDGSVITSRKPDDLPVFCDAVLQALRVPVRQ